MTMLIFLPGRIPILRNIRPLVHKPGPNGGAYAMLSYRLCQDADMMRTGNTNAIANGGGCHKHAGVLGAVLP